MNAVVVYKTTDLHNAVSGISGTIDLRTRRPFDLKDGFTVSGTGEYARGRDTRSEEHTSELQSLMRISYAVFCLKKKNKNNKKYIRIKINNYHINSKNDTIHLHTV